MKFDANYALSKALLGWYFYKDLKQSIKVWIDDDSWELFACDDLVKKLLKANAKAKI